MQKKGVSPAASAAGLSLMVASIGQMQCLAPDSMFQSRTLPEPCRIPTTITAPRTTMGINVFSHAIEQPNAA
jgi:hypothetical protein